MIDTTPAYSIRIKDEIMNALAYDILLSKASKVEKIIELFGGMGRMTQLISKHFPTSKIISFDLDKKCCDTIKKIVPNAIVLMKDSLQNNYYIDECSGVLCDFNLLTIKTFHTKFKYFFDDMLNRNPSWFILTDSCISKLKMNYIHYNMNTPKLKEYIELYKIYLIDYDYELKKTIKAHNRSFMMLFERRYGYAL